MRGIRARAAVAAALIPVLAVSAFVAPRAHAAGEPDLWSPHAPLTRHQTVSISYLAPGSHLVSVFLLANDGALDSQGKLVNGALVTPTTDWTLAAGEDGPRVVFGQVQYTDGSWSPTTQLAFELDLSPGSAMLIDVDWLNLNTPLSDVHVIRRSPATHLHGWTQPVNGPAVASFVTDGIWRVGIVDPTRTYAPGVHQTGVTPPGELCADVCVTVEPVAWMNAPDCFDGPGTVTIHEVQLHTDRDVRTLDADFRMQCQGRIFAGSIRYGSDRPLTALDQSVEHLTFRDVNVGETSASQTLTFTNIGDTPVEVGEAALSDFPNFAAPDAFELTSDECSLATIDPGGSCRIDVTFTALERGGHSALLTLPDSTVNGARKVVLRGIGEQLSTIELQVSDYFFGTRTKVVMTVSPPRGSGLCGPRFWLEGPEWSMPWWSIDSSDPEREVFTGYTDLLPGDYVATATLENCMNYRPAAAEPVEFSVTGDPTPPTGTLTINGFDPHSNELDVVFYAPATDEDSSVSGFAIAWSRTNTFNWITFPSYSPNGTIRLFEGDGLYTIKAKWKNYAGVWSEPVEATINLDTVAPQVSAPRQEIVEGSSISSGRVTVRVPWAAVDGGSGIGSTTLAQRTNSGAWKVVASTATGLAQGSGTVDRVLKPGNAHTFRANAIDQATNNSGWAMGPKVGLKVFQESNAKVTRTGKWKSASGSMYWGSAARYSVKAGATTSMTFTGRTVGWVSRMGPDRGRAEVYVNNVLVKTVDLYAASYSNQRVVWAQTWDSAATRTVKIRVVGTAGRPRVDLDAFVVGQ